MILKGEIYIHSKRAYRFIVFVLISIFITSGCSLGFKKNSDQNDQQNTLQKSSFISPNVKLNEQYYRGVLPYKSSPINGMLREIPSRLDNKYFEFGLIDLAKTVYDPSTYIFQEGQILTMNEIEPLLDKDQYPQFENFVYAVTEHDYLLEDGKLGGMAVGILVSPNYNLKNKNGDYVRDFYGRIVSKDYSEQILKEKTKALIDELIKIIRKKVNTSIVFGVMKAQSTDIKIPGTFILSGFIKEGKNKVEDYKDIDENYIFLPSSQQLDPEYNNIEKIFDLFKEKMDDYLPNFSGITGLARIKDGELIEVTIKVNSEFDSTVETIQFTQFAVSMIAKYFPKQMPINLYINSINRPRALYVKKANGDDFMHIYRD